MSHYIPDLCNHRTEIEVWGTAATAYVGDYYEWNGSLQTMTKYYYAGTTRAAVRNGNGTGANGLVYLLSDHLGSTSITADPLDGDKLSELRYKAWGETRYALTSLPTDRRFTGQVEEAGIGLYYFNARWYDNSLGRWAQPDTIIPQNQGVQAWDRYAYSNNSPVVYSDPSGHCIFGIDTVICLALAGAAIGAAVGYGAQVYDNYKDGNSNPWTENISAEPIVGGAFVGAGAVIFAPAVVAGAGDVLVGAGLATGSTALFNAGMDAYGASTSLANVIYPVSYPTLEIDSGVMPNISQNIQTAQANGAPSVLTRMEDEAAIRANRAAATAGFTGVGSPDEYPFASTYEGGAGAFVKGVPIAEQWVQGGVISQFYQNNNIVDGSKFKVLVK